MRKVLTLLVTLCLLMFSSLASAANIKNHPRLAVMQFGNKAIMSQGLQTGDFVMCSEYAIYQLVACDWFDLVDYEQLENIAKMHSINMSGLVDQSTAVQLGKFASAQFMVVSNVTGLTAKNSTLGVNAGNSGNISGSKHTVTANVVMRIVDIETGRIVAAGMGTGSSSSTNAEIVFNAYRKNQTTTTTYGYGGATGDDPYEPINQNIPEITGTDNTISDTPEASNNSTITATTTNTEYEKTSYSIVIGTTEIADIQVRNALGKAVRDAVYGRTGLMTMLNGGKPLKIKTGF